LKTKKSSKQTVLIYGILKKGCEKANSKKILEALLILDFVYFFSFYFTLKVDCFYGATRDTNQI